MRLFAKKWRPPDPHLAMVISLANPELPSPVMLANPAGADGAVEGLAGPADAKPDEENMTGPMKEGNYFAISPSKAGISLRVERGLSGHEPLSVEPAMFEAAGLTAEMLAKFNSPVWRVILQMELPGKDVAESVMFATQIARRLAELGDGVVMDGPAYRFFGPAGWPVEDPIGELDAREHVQVHFESDSHWLHTHGLIKFGRPELEIYEVPQELVVTAFVALLDISQYVISSALIEPGQTCGDPSQPFHARDGTKNRDHWDDMPVLELVDLDEDGEPVRSGAPRALRHYAAQSAGDAKGS